MVTTQSYHRRNLGGLNKIVAYIFTVIRMGLSKHAGIGRQKIWPVSAAEPIRFAQGFGCVFMVYLFIP